MKRKYNRKPETIERETKPLFDYKSFVAEYAQHIATEIKTSSNTRIPFLTTTRFHRIPLSTSSMKQQYRFFVDSTWTQYSKTYHFILTKLANNYSKKTYLHPRTYDFFDVDNTRTNINAAFTENTIPHIHSIYLIHKDTLDTFQNLINDQFSIIVNHPSMCEFVQSIHSKEITHNLPQAVAYCSKFYDNCYARNMRNECDLFHQFPITDKEKEALAIERENLPHHFIPKMLEESNEYMRMRFNRT